MDFFLGYRFGGVEGNMETVWVPYNIQNLLHFLGGSFWKQLFGDDCPNKVGKIV